MAARWQQPATPKVRRALLKATAQIFGPDVALRRSGLQHSERAALSYRSAVAAQTPNAPEVQFILPMVGRHQVDDWSTVMDRLALTLESFRTQTDPNWAALVCGQDRPGLDAFEDSRIAFLEVPVIEGHDKWPKLSALCDALPEDFDGYVMPFDADDLLAPGAVAEMRTRRRSGGYVVSKGYLLDLGAGRLAQTRPRSLLEPGQKPFWKLCGSCAAFRVQGRDGLDFLKATTQHEHRMFPYLAALSGRPLAAFEEPAALYVVNHGQNFSVRRGRGPFKERFAKRFEIRDESQKAKVLAEFGLSPESRTLPAQD